ncbi:AAEL010252-PA [Aedes aegypti]|uniref:AAEL010252-PA n=1 Tax=Aedes aegypti TaxID=7159 RepID=Q16TG5_AEDAE|nr:AAEL010252-PA [Aedes aegypti]
MSYTTQKEFFNVSFRNEAPRLPERKRSDGALMTYDLCTDGRAWALDKQKRSNYILDVVHKARFKKAMLHPEGQFELTKDYLIHLDVDDLAEYILSLQAEIKRKNDSVLQLEETRRTLDEQLEAIQAKSDELSEIQQQSAMLAEERNDFEQQLEDLEKVIVDLKERADRYDLLAKENASLRDQLQHQRTETADRIRLINAEVEANFNRMITQDYDKLEAELVLFKAQYEDLRQQKRDLKEQLQKAFVQQGKMTELRRQLALEQSHREKVEDELEHLLSLYDQRFQALDEQPVPAIEDFNRQRTEQWVESRALSSADEEPRAQLAPYRGESIRPETAVEVVVESCMNCARLEQQLENLRSVQVEELQEREKESEALQEQYNLLKKELELSARARDEEMKKQEDIQKQQLAQLESIRKEQAPSKDQPPTVDAAEFENLKKTNEDLQKEIARLLAAQNANQDDVAKTAESQAELIKTIENLRSELQSTNQTVKEKEEAMRQMEVEVEKTRSTQQLGAAETVAAHVQEVEQLSRKNDELENKLKQCERDMEERKRELEDQKRRLAEEDQARKSLTARNDEATKLAETQSELIKTIENLRLELQNTTDMVKEKDEAIRKMEVEMGMMRSEQQLGAAESAAAAVQETERLSRKVEELEEKLKQCNTELAERKDGEAAPKGGDVTDDVDHQEKDLTEIAVTEVSDEVAEVEGGLSKILDEVESTTKQRESLIDGEEYDNIAQEASQETITAGVQDEQRASIKSAAAKSDSEAKIRRETDRDSEDASEIQHAEDDRQSLTESDTVLGDEASIRQIDQSVKIADVEATELIGEETKRDSHEKENSILDELTQEQRTRLEQNGFMDDDIIRIGTSDPDKTRLIAIKIVHHGMDVLVIAELDHLHRELCRAIIERYLMLGKNVQTIDKAMHECHQILDMVKEMGNHEMNSMLASPATQVPIRNPLLMEDDIPVRLPAKSKSRPKSTSLSQGSNALKKAGRVLVGDYDDTLSNFMKSAPKKQGKVVVDSGDQCRTRPWRAPKTPVETIVASTLVDGSRVVARQKRYS